MAVWRLAVLLVVCALFTAPLAASELTPAWSQGGVSVKAERGLESRAPEIGKLALLGLARMRGDMPGFAAEKPVEIRLIWNSKDVLRHAPRGVELPEWTAGVAFPGHGLTIVAVRDGLGQFLPLHATVLHELAHLFLHQGMDGKHYPRWLTEGFAQVYEGGSGWSEHSKLAGAAWLGGLHSFAELGMAFPSHQYRASLAYVQSEAFVRFLMERGPRPGMTSPTAKSFRKFLAELAKGSSLEEASLTAYRVRFDTLTGEWESALRDRWVWLPASTFLGSIWIVAAILLIVGWWRRRREGQRRLAIWAEQESLQDHSIN